MQCFGRKGPETTFDLGISKKIEDLRNFTVNTFGRCKTAALCRRLVFSAGHVSSRLCFVHRAVFEVKATQIVLGLTNRARQRGGKPQYFLYLGVVPPRGFTLVKVQDVNSDACRNSYGLLSHVILCEVFSRLPRFYPQANCLGWRKDLENRRS